MRCARSPTRVDLVAAVSILTTTVHFSFSEWKYAYVHISDRMCVCMCGTVWVFRFHRFLQMPNYLDCIDIFVCYFWHYVCIRLVAVTFRVYAWRWDVKPREKNQYIMEGDWYVDRLVWLSFHPQTGPKLSGFFEFKLTVPRKLEIPCIYLSRILNQ